MNVDHILKIIAADPIDIAALEEALNAVSHDARIAATRKFSPKIQKRLFAAVEGRSVTKEQMMPTDGSLAEVIHEGTNTLPAFRKFQKRFAKPTQSENRDSVGYNQMWYTFAVSPGYFVGYEEGDEFVIDYTLKPTEKVSSWPNIISNKFGLGIFIWSGMTDRVRRVSEHVTIGRAFRKGKPQNAYFTLVRCDPKLLTD